MPVDRENTCIDTLQARGVRKDDPAIRLGLSNLLERADLKPPGLPPSAILVVKRMPDPRPGALAASLNRIHPDREWERAVREQLDRYRRGAVRPHNGVIPEDAEAAIFEDDAEFRACLCLDLANETAGRCWWWKASLRRLPAAAGPSLSVATVLGEAPAIAPAVLMHLYNWRLQETVLTAVDPADARRVSALIAGEYALHKVGDMLAGQPPATSDRGAYEDGGTFTETRGRREPEQARSTSSSVARHGVAILWNRYLGGRFVPVALGREQAFLCGLSVLLQQQPWRLRDPECHAVLDRLSSESAAATTGPLPDGALPAERAAEAVESHRRGGDDGGRPSADSRDDSETEGTDPARRDRRARDVAAEDAVEKDAVQRTGMDAITTDIGGVLYLINLMTALDLPACFEKDWNPPGCAGPWAVLEVLARALLEAIDDTGVTDDPLWGVLAQLDGREPGEPPGAGLAVADEYRLPAAWFKAVASERECFRWSATEGRIRLWSTAGYLLVDLPCAGQDANRRARRELHAYIREWRAGQLTESANDKPPLAQHRFADRLGLSAGMKAWLGRVMPYIHYRLGRAAGDDTAACLSAILHCRAAIYAGPSHVDLVTPMDNISIAARSSGLDRDPGWLPGFGRVVHFHFE